MSLPILVTGLVLSCAPLTDCERVVAIQPLGPVDPAVVRTIAERVETLYAAEVRVLPETPLPAKAWYAPRRRYRGEAILEHLAARAPAGVTKVVGVTARDVSVTRRPHPDWGVMGVAQLDRRAAVISTFRLGRQATAAARVRRARDVAVHELGHTFGLAHCPARRCVMNDARGRLATVDATTGEFCGGCRAELGATLRPPSIASAERPRRRGSMRMARIP